MISSKITSPRTAVLALFCVTSLTLSPVAWAEDASQSAQAHLAELRFDEAQKVAQKALDAGKSQAPELVRLYMVLGQVSASTGDDSQATAMFLNALSIDAAVELPEGVSPKLSEPFTAARARLEGAKPISLESQQLDEGLLVITVDSDPANLIGGARLDYRLKGKSATLRGQGRSSIEIVVPSGATALKVSAVDMHGNQLTAAQEVAWEESQEDSKIVSGSDSAGTSSDLAVYEHWQIYAGLAGAAVVGGLYLGKTAEDFAADVGALEDGTEFSVAKALEDKAQRRALYANISFVGAGLFGAAAFWMYSRVQDPEPESKPKSALIVPTLSPDGVGIAASLRF